MKENEKIDKHLDLDKELKKNNSKNTKKQNLLIMNVTVIPIVVWALGTVSKGFLKTLGKLEIRGRIETIQIMALLKSA